MWKISQIYLSDFRAGDNYMDDGLIKALDDSGESRDCLIFSPNGTFKTSLLSIVLSQFSPNKDRFIQTLQSPSKKIEDYVIMQRPALVMTKFVSSNNQESLFSEIDADSLVIGQLLFLRPSSSSNNKHELERLFFMGRGGSVFNQTRQLFLSLRAERTGWDQLRKTLADFAEVEETQRDWLKKLDAAGLDSFLVDKKVEMCKEEGGIASTLKFTDENAFMSFFLNMAMNIERSADLHGNVLRAMDKNRNMPKRKKELIAANRLVTILQSFESTAGKWRGLEGDRQTRSSRIGEAAHVLEVALPYVTKAKEKVKEMADEVDRQRIETNRTQQEALADKNLINQEKLRRQLEELSAKDRKCSQQIQVSNTELVAIEGSTLFSEVDIKQRTLTTSERALEAASSKLAPMKKYLNGKQAAYHVRLAYEKSQLEEKKGSKQVDLNAVVNKKETSVQLLKENNKKLAADQRREDRVKTKIEAAEKEVQLLALESGESPQQALLRLQEEQQTHEGHIKGSHGSSSHR